MLIPKSLQRGFEAGLNPFVERLIARRVNPNVLTTVGTLILVGSAVAFGWGGVRLGGFLLLLSGVFDMLDGRVARGGGNSTKFGAFYDSTLDRIGESALFGGIAVFFLRGGVPDGLINVAVIVAIVALASALTISYARARAEGLGLECKVGIAQRAERILGLGAPCMFFGAGPNGYLLFGIIVLLAVVGLVTVVQRVHHVYKLTRGSTRIAHVRHTAPRMTELARERK